MRKNASRKSPLRWFWYFVVVIAAMSALSALTEGNIGLVVFDAGIVFLVNKYLLTTKKPARVNDRETIQSDTHYAKSITINERNQTAKKKYSYRKKRAFVDQYTVIDFETTGFSPENNEIIEIGAVKFSNGEPQKTFQTYIKPNKRIDSHITSINGISNEMVKDSPKEYEVLPKLLEFIGDDVIVAHNASFDIRFLLAALDKNNIEHEFDNFVSDTLSLSRKCFPMLKNHKLETLKKHFRLDQYQSHRATDDCIVTGKIYWECKIIS